MTHRKNEEEIIELTEVIEEGPGKITPVPLKQPGGEGSKEGKAVHGFAAIPETPLRKFSNSDLEREPAQPAVPDYEFEWKSTKEALQARAEEWMSSEGGRILERVAREIFPKIAEEVLRKEIEKIKAQVEEKE